MDSAKVYSFNPSMTEFKGAYASDVSLEKILSKLDAFVSEDFEYFRDLAEEEELGMCETDSIVRCFGNDNRWYYIHAQIDDNQNVRFAIYDEDGVDIIVFVLSRMAEDLKRGERDGYRSKSEFSESAGKQAEDNDHGGDDDKVPGNGFRRDGALRPA